MYRYKALIVLLMCALCAIGADASGFRRTQIRDSLMTALPNVTTSADSIIALYNIFDLSASVSERSESASQLMALAERTGNDTVVMDMIRQMANANQADDSLMVRLLERMEAFPESNLKKETLAFIRVCRAAQMSKMMTEDMRQQKILDLIKEYSKSDADDPYEQMTQLFAICSFLSNETHGQLLMEYFSDLQHYVAMLPLTTFLIRNRLYLQQAITYTNNGESRKAIEADRKMLDIMDELEEDYRRQGRLYCNFDLNRYVSLRRILKNYQALTDSEAEEYYRQIQDVASKHESARADMEYYRQPQMCIYMKRGDYAKAMPIIKSNLEKSSDIFSRRYYLQLMMTAAEALGDTEARLATSMEYARSLEDFVKLKSAERYRELQIIYEVNRLKDRNTVNELERQRESNRLKNIVINISVIALIVLIIVAMVFVGLFRRFKRLSASLKQSNRELEHESEVLRSTRDRLIAARDKASEAEKNKTDFINYISHEIITPLNTITEYSQMIIDSTDESRRDYLSHFSRVVQLNTLMLQSFVLDLQDFSLLESTRMTVKIRPTDIKSICLLSLDNVKINLNPGVSLRFPKKDAEPVLIETDPYRLQVVLLNLLNNAAKFTESGTITLDYEIKPDQVMFTVTDTGCGVPEGKEETIFNRFTTDDSSSGHGLGLPVCRLIATLLHGSVELDTAYTGGARFIFTIPR